MTARVTLLIDLGPEHTFRRATLDAFRDAASAEFQDVSVVPIGTADWATGSRELGDGVVVGPGSPYEDDEAVYDAIRRSRERGVPLLGT